MQQRVARLLSPTYPSIHPSMYPRGISNKPADVDIYCCPIMVFSQDENSKERRCGILTYSLEIDGVWFAYTDFHIFTDTWIPNKFPGYDPSAKVVGKPCYEFEWTSSHKDITTDPTDMKNVRKIGVVEIGLSRCDRVKIRLDKDFVSTPMFQNEGIWIE